MFRTAKGVIQECIDRYSDFGSYRDRGVVSTWYSDNPEVVPHQIDFSTLYCKPNLFRFEYINPHPYPLLRHILTRYVCGFDGEHAYTVRQKHEENAVLLNEESLGKAIARSTGTSCRSIHNIAKLLLPCVGTGWVDRLSSIRLSNQIEVEGESCYEIEGVHQTYGPTRICVSKSDFTVRKYLSIINGFRSEEIRTHIVLNKDVEINLFELD